MGEQGLIRCGTGQSRPRRPRQREGPEGPAGEDEASASREGVEQGSIDAETVMSLLFLPLLFLFPFSFSFI